MTFEQNEADREPPELGGFFNELWSLDLVFAKT
jgi:hypothetical protein